MRPPPRERDALRRWLEELYAAYNRREFVRPDPLQFLYDYPDPADREIVGFLASYLAYGRVAQILKSVTAALAPLGTHPAAFLRGAPARRLREATAGFRHRFTDAETLAAILAGLQRTLRRRGSLQASFVASYRPEHTDVQPALRAFVAELAGDRPELLPCPSRGSACKRLNLFLRWMVRCDGVDPGGWTGVRPAHLIVPLDTHMHRVGRELGFTRRRAADLRAALEITAAFATLCPGDPVKYDFALTRLGIRADLREEAARVSARPAV